MDNEKVKCWISTKRKLFVSCDSAVWPCDPNGIVAMLFVSDYFRNGWERGRAQHAGCNQIKHISYAAVYDNNLHVLKGMRVGMDGAMQVVIGHSVIEVP